MSHLLQPIQIGSMTLANRLVMPPLASGKAEDGKVGPALLDYYHEITAGGYLGLAVVEHSYILAEGKASPNQMSIADDRMVGPLMKLAALIHGNGSKCVLQINHAGSMAAAKIIGRTPAAPSAIGNPRNPAEGTPRELTREEIADIVVGFHQAARRVREAGFDGVEIHAAHGYLLNQFYSPLTNRRQDEYGGDLYRRIRLLLQVIEAVRAAVGRNFPILLRLGASDCRDDGTTLADSCRACGEFERAGVDALDISGGFCGFDVPGLTGQGYFAPWTEAIKKTVAIPVILTGGVSAARAAEELLAAGQADLIGVGRALLRDSGWARKAVESLG